MNEYRKLLMRKIDHAFAQGKYPFFYGICGMGKHEALHGYAQRQKRVCKTLNGEMPDDPSCIYMIDQFDDERYLRRLCEALKTQTACHVCFISEHMLPACMYELMLERIQLFPADDFCFSLSECQRLLRSEHLDEEQIKAIFLHSDGCLAAIRYHLRREQEDLERYWTAYLSHCYQLFSDAQQKLMHQLSTIGSLEREGAQELLQADPEMLRQLVNAGMLREEAGILRVPACLRWPLSEDETLLDSLFEYHLRKGQIVRAWRCARSLSQQEKLFTARGGELALMAKEDELPMLQEASQGYFLMQAIVLFRQHCQLQLHTLLHAAAQRDEAYFLAWLLCEDLELDAWIQAAREAQIELDMPAGLWISGFLKSRLWLPWLLEDSRQRQSFMTCLNAESRSWLRLIDAEIAMERDNQRQCEAILDRFGTAEEKSAELRFLICSLSIRYHFSQGCRKELIVFPEDLKREIILRDDQLTTMMHTFLLERAIWRNDQIQLADTYIKDGLSDHPYARLCQVTMLYRLDRCEKALLQLGSIMKEYAYHDYIVSQLRYLCALCLYVMRQETRALKLLAASLAFNGPYRFCTSFCFFGTRTRELMEIYIRFLNKDIGGHKKKYRKATDLIHDETAEYRDYIQMIADRARAYDELEVKEPGLLTPKEIRILGHIEAGLTNLQIAHQLNIGMPTVKSHISSIFAKLGVRNRASAISEARKIGYLR